MKKLGGDECGGKRARKPRAKKVAAVEGGKVKRVRKSMPKAESGIEGMEVVEIQKKGSAMDIKGLIKESAKPKMRAPSKRNQIVKKVMADKKMSMIEASKYVKEHKLY